MAVLAGPLEGTKGAVVEGTGGEGRLAGLKVYVQGGMANPAVLVVRTAHRRLRDRSVAGVDAPLLFLLVIGSPLNGGLVAVTAVPAVNCGTNEVVEDSGQVALLDAGGVDRVEMAVPAFVGDTGGVYPAGVTRGVLPNPGGTKKAFACGRVHCTACTSVAVGTVLGGAVTRRVFTCGRGIASTMARIARTAGSVDEVDAGVGTGVENTVVDGVGSTVGVLHDVTGGGGTVTPGTRQNPVRLVGVNDRRADVDVAFVAFTEVVGTHVSGSAAGDVGGIEGCLVATLDVTGGAVGNSPVDPPGPRRITKTTHEHDLGLSVFVEVETVTASVVVAPTAVLGGHGGGVRPVDRVAYLKLGFVLEGAA
jgi:hypothetical protein